MDISIIIPVYSEENSILPMFDEIRSAFLNYAKSYELIFINDGSLDNSLNILKDIAKKHGFVRIISFDKNYGKTFALDAGLKNAKGEIVLTIDADLQYDPKDLLNIIAELENSNIDAVLGRRINRTSGFIKKICSHVAIFIRNKVLKESYKGCYLAGYKKQALKNLILYKGFQDFIPCLLKMEGCSVKEINVKEYPRKYGKSKYGIMNRFLKGLCALLVVKWMKDNRPKYRIIQKSR
jgi:dolichol-phosphate mannosyltransferase